MGRSGEGLANRCILSNLNISFTHLLVPKGAGKKAGEDLLARACGDNTRGNGSKLREGRFRLAIRSSSL